MVWLCAWRGRFAAWPSIILSVGGVDRCAARTSPHSQRDLKPFFCFFFFLKATEPERRLSCLCDSFFTEIPPSPYPSVNISSFPKSSTPLRSFPPIPLRAEIFFLLFVLPFTAPYRLVLFRCLPLETSPTFFFFFPPRNFYVGFHTSRPNFYPLGNEGTLAFHRHPSLRFSPLTVSNRRARPHAPRAFFPLASAADLHVKRRLAKQF